MKPHHSGFTLIELAIVMLVLTILAAGLLVPLTSSIETQRYKQTQQILEDSKEALIGYARSHTTSIVNNAGIVVSMPLLPCPDTTQSNDGLEDRMPSGGCQVQEGNLPWVTLGVGRSDAWGNHIHYRVTQAFSTGIFSIPIPSNSFALSCVLPTSPPTSLVATCNPPPLPPPSGTIPEITDIPAISGNTLIALSCTRPECTLSSPLPAGSFPSSFVCTLPSSGTSLSCTSKTGSDLTCSPKGDMSICNSASGSCSGTALVAQDLPVVIMSYGKNGAGAISTSGTQQAAPTSADELENTNGDTKFVWHSQTDPGNSEFDDLVAWLPTDLLLAESCPH